MKVAEKRIVILLFLLIALIGAMLLVSTYSSEDRYRTLSSAKETETSVIEAQGKIQMLRDLSGEMGGILRW